MGRIATATAVLEASGAYKAHPDRRRKFEPQAGGIGPAPKHMDADARALWDETVSNAAPGVFQSGDRHALEDYCRLRALSRRDFEHFPADKMRLLVSFMARFGLTPADRSRVHVPKTPPGGKGATGLASFLEDK